MRFGGRDKTTVPPLALPLKQHKTLISANINPNLDITQADGKTAGRVVRGAKGSKGSKGIAAAASAGQGIDDAIVPRGQFSVDASADAKGSTRKKRSSFRMADAKALTRALARGEQASLKGKGVNFLTSGDVSIHQTS